MHWFWVTRSAALLLLSATIAALPLGPYALPTQSNISEQPDIHDDSTVTDWPLHLSEEPLQAGHYIPDTYSTDLLTATQDSYHSSTESSTVLLPVVHVPDVADKEMEDSPVTAITESNISTYLHSGTEEVELLGGATPFVFHTRSSSNSTKPSESQVLLYPTVTEEHVFTSVSSADSSQFLGKQSIVSDDEENVPVMKSALISEIGNENQNFFGVEETTVSINGVPKYSTAEDNSSMLITSKDLKNVTQSVFNSSESFLLDNVNISLDPMIDNLNSFNHNINKPLVNTPRLITRDVRNSSELSINTSSPVSILTSHELDQDVPDHTSLPSSLLTQLKPLTLRTGKSAGYFHPQHHPLVLTTISSSKDGPDAFPFPHSSNISDVMQGYKQGPKSSDDLINSRYVEAIVKDSEVPEDEKSDSRVIWISRTPVSDITPEHGKMISEVESKPDSIGMSHFEDVEMADSPYNPPESSTFIGSRPQTAGDGVSKPPPTSSHEFVVPINRTVDGSEDNPSNSDHFSLGPNVTGQGKERVKVTPQLMNSSKVMGTASHSVLQSDNRTKSGHIAPIDSENGDGNTSVGSSTDDANSTTIIGEAGSLSADTRSSVLPLPTRAPGLKQVGNVTAAKDDEDNETNIVTILSTIVPVSKGRVASAADESHHELDAASITGISLGILVFAGLVGAVSFVLYRRRFLNKPQTLNDKCSNPDSSGYIDDSTLRENSEEMYSLDNDSFLNSLEAMTIQNYWTDNVKHTKL